MELLPSIRRVVTRVTGLMLVATSLGYLQQGYFEHKWWTLRYVSTLVIPFSIMPFGVWLLFVPGYLRFNSSALIIKPRFRAIRKLLWSDLSQWGTANGVFLLNFQGSPAIQIFSAAYPPEQWSKLTQFLVQEHSERKASGFVGAFGFRIRR